jgi:bifunctional UDP-N-acetylglucosamine pyrophosphorylase/glucosamine-1-phosphate N-acetyltransferase
MNLTAVILAAGEGKRIKPIVTAKALLPFCGQAIISWLVEDLKKAGINKFILISSPQNQPLFKKLFRQQKNLQIVVQPKPAGMADALLSAQREIGSKPIIVINGVDIVSSSCFKDFLNQLQSKQPDILLTGLQVDHYLPGGYFKLEAKQVKAIIEKPGAGKQPSPFLNIVIHYFKNSQEFIAVLKKTTSKKDDVYELALSKLMRTKKVALFEYQHYFNQLKYPYQLLDVREAFLNHRLKTGFSRQAQIHHRAVIDGSVQIEAGAKIMAGAVIKGPAYIGKNVIIGNNALVRQSNIEQGSVVGYNTEIARSYVGPNNWFHCNFVGDSVIEADCNLGSGARLANWRFDKKEIYLQTSSGRLATGKTKFGAVLAKGVKLGINASIMPGVMIGKNSLIDPGAVVYHSIC